MRIEIFKVSPKANEWAQVSAPYSFRPQHGQDTPYAILEVPDVWMLVGEPEPLLVRRAGDSMFVSRTATEALYHGAMVAEGFRVLEIPGGENVQGDPVEVPRAVLYYRVATTEQADAPLPALAGPPRSNNGRALAKRGPK